jgi:hypothetical protein
MRMLSQLSASTVLAASLCLGAAVSLDAQVIRGRILEDPSSRPISGASVALVGAVTARSAATANTGSDGGFSITAPSPGIYRLLAELPGYRTAVTPAFELFAGDQVQITLRLLSDTARLRPMVVTANARQNNNRLSGFSRRNAFGRYITRDQIDRMHPIFVSDLLRTAPGVQVVASPRGFGYDVLTTEGCRPAIYVDGLHYTLMGGETIDQVVNPNEIDSIEVYAHAAEVPPEYMGPGSTCGAIVIWTKRGP